VQHYRVAGRQAVVSRIISSPSGDATRHIKFTVQQWHKLICMWMKWPQSRHGPGLTQSFLSFFPEPPDLVRLTPTDYWAIQPPRDAVGTDICISWNVTQFELWGNLCSLSPQCLNCQGVERVEPPSYFLDPPNAVPDFVLGGGSVHTAHVRFTSHFGKTPTAKKTQSPAIFHNSNPVSPVENNR